MTEGKSEHVPFHTGVHHRPGYYLPRVCNPHVDPSCDVEDVLHAFDVTNPRVAEAIRKLFRAGRKPGESFEKDVTKALEALQRELDYRALGESPVSPPWRGKELRIQPRHVDLRADVGASRDLIHLRVLAQADRCEEPTATVPGAPDCPCQRHKHHEGAHNALGNPEHRQLIVLEARDAGLCAMQVRHPAGLVCTMERGHSGPHTAHASPQGRDCG